MDEAATDSAEATKIWRVLEGSLQSQQDGRLVLAELGGDIDRGVDSLRAWLTGPGAALITQVHGGSVDKIVNIARAGAVNIYQPSFSLPVPRQLPAGLHDFSDRKNALTRITRSLGRPTSGPHIIAISGPGGVGKTSLAIRAANLMRTDFPDGQLYVELQGQSKSPLDAYEVQATFLRALGIDAAAIPTDHGERGGLFRSMLAERRVLILLDNASSEGQLRPLLPGDAKCAVLITSRKQLLGLEGTYFVRLDGFSASQSVAMLSSIVGARRCRQQATGAAEIARLCGGLPLALRLAGTRLAANELLPLASMAASLEDESRRLKELSVGDREVRATLKLSYDRTPEREQALFRLLSILDIQDFRSWVAASLLNFSLEEAEALLDGLVENQLLNVEKREGGQPTRYRFHDLTRLLGRELAQGDPSQARAEAVDRVLSNYCRLAEFHAAQLAPGGYFEVISQEGSAEASYPDPIRGVLAEDSYRWFADEYSTLRWAAEYCASGASSRYTWRLALALQDFLELQGNLQDWHRLALLGIQSAERDYDERAVALSRRSLGIVLLYQGAAGDAVQELRNAIISGGSDLDKTNAITHRSLGEALSEIGHRDEAIDCFVGASRTFARLGLQEWAAWTEWSLGVSRGVHGDFSNGAATLRQCVSMFEELQHARGLAVTLRSLSDIAIGHGRVEEATSELEQCIPLFRATGDRLGEALAMNKLAELRSAAGRTDEAAELQAACQPYLQQIGETGGFR